MGRGVVCLCGVYVEADYGICRVERCVCVCVCDDDYIVRRVQGGRSGPPWTGPLWRSLYRLCVIVCACVHVSVCVNVSACVIYCHFLPCFQTVALLL